MASNTFFFVPEQLRRTNLRSYRAALAPRVGRGAATGLPSGHGLARPGIAIGQRSPTPVFDDGHEMALKLISGADFW